MIRKSVVVFCLLLSLVYIAKATPQHRLHIKEGDITQGYVVKKLWLQAYSLPQVTAHDLNYIPVDEVPPGTPVSFPDSLTLHLGMERKRPFVLVQLPVFAREGSQLMQLTDVTLTVTEHAPPSNDEHKGIAAATMKTTATQSLLASGNWHKIAVLARGIYKVDHAFLKSQLIVTGSVPSAAIRLLGHGGTMLPENNAAHSYIDPPENAIWMHDGCDGSFDPGDYFLFYATGPTGWEKDSVQQRFMSQKNIYEDKSYYFLSVDGANGLRANRQANGGSANITVTSFDDYMAHEEDLVSVSKIGKDWVGEEFSNQPGRNLSNTFEFPTGSVIGPIHMQLKLVGAGLSSGSIFSVYANGQLQGQHVMNPATDQRRGSVQLAEYLINPSGASLSVRLDFLPSLDGRGFLDYIILNMRRPLSYSTATNQLSFRDWQSVAPGNIARYEIQTGGAPIQVWDVTNPVQPVAMNGSVQGQTYVFIQEASRLREFIAFGTQYHIPEYMGSVGNQNLKGQGHVDYIIVTHPGFIDAAEQLAAFHRAHNNLRTIVTTTTQIYNEFSSGSQDISAIRNYVKMFYDRAGTNDANMPKYLLLFGDASYDYKNRLPGNTNFVPAFESRASYYLDSTSCNDDFFAILDDNEYIEDYTIPNTLDVGVGRLPIKTLVEGYNVVDKIAHYKSNASLGPWRLINTYIGDNEDNAGAHLLDAEIMNATVDSLDPMYNSNKVYLDNMPFVSTPGGTRSPESNKAINDQVFRGTFMINYSGHGNTKTLAHERILTAEDFNTWKNIDKLPFMVTATCDFAQFDNPAEVSSGERLVLKRDGGAIALLTTTQAVYAGPNRNINRQFLETQFTQDANGKWHTFGDAFRMGKNATYQTTPGWWVVDNFRKFTLLGDPALTPNFPQYFVHTESIKVMGTDQTADTIGALGGYTISGNVTDVNGQILNDFNGFIYVSFYDKPRVVTLNTKVYGIERSYEVQNNVIYKGKATVINGRFVFSFIAPKDINYNYGSGKISYYAENGVTDAAGLDTNVVIGGMARHPYVEYDAPIVKPYMNDSLFIDGGITGSNSLLYVALYDETGINVSGNSVGHDLTAVLDGGVDKPYVLNDYYETAADDYRRGYVHFPITGLTDGFHTLRVKAWDMNNNSGEGEVRFLVVDGEVMKVEKLMNYPNPFSDKTHFVFEHNHPDEPLTATIMIYNLAGAHVATVQRSFTPAGSRTHELSWDGTGSNGAKLPAGMYLYKLNIATRQGISATAYEKLILLR